MMQKIDKNKDPFTYQIQFTQVKNFKSLPWAYIPLIFLSLALYSAKLYELIHPDGNPYSNIPFLTIFIIQIFIIASVAVLSIVSFYFKLFNNLWAYLILICQAVGIIFVETTMQCFEQAKWCQGDTKYQTSTIILLCLYALIIWLRSCFYYPFYDNFSYISMSSSAIVIFDFIYKLLLCAITSLSFINSIQSERKFTILVTLALFCIHNSSNYYCCPLINNCWLVVNTFVTWTVIIIYLLPYLDVISTTSLKYQDQTESLFWYVWGYSTPCIIAYVIISNLSIDLKDGWKMLFLEEKHQIKNLDTLYLMTSQLKQKLRKSRKSQQKVNDPLFKIIWGLIQKHNQFCDHIECPLTQLKDIQIHKYDDFLEQKRLGKSIQACYEFGLYHLERKKDKFPNLLELSMQIANYELEVFQNRQKGLLLYTQFYNKEEIDSNQKFTLYYLKKKIQELFIDNQNYTKTNTENQISQFRHNIEVSVSMLAQFWYFLADPKCNLKKLYDLANILFPLKIGVDNEWKNIQKLKNIESYHLYARYLIKMFNDKEKGMKILQEAKKIEHQLKNREEVQVDPQGNSNIRIEQNGIIFLQFDGKNPGVMYQVNLAAQKIFGYNKGQLINRKVNDIMPRLFANHHDKILQNYQQTNKTKMMNKQRIVWGKSKDGYLFPFSILIKPVKNLLSNSSQVYACIKRQNWVKESAFLTLDMNDQISEISSALLGIYPDLYGKVNIKKKLHISEIIPNFVDLKQQMLDQKQSMCQLQIERQFYLSQKQRFKEVTTFNLSMEQIVFTVAGHVGYLLKFQKVVNVSQKDAKNLQLSRIGQSRLKQNNFRFIYQISQNSKNLNEYKSFKDADSNQNRVTLRYKGGQVYDMDEMAKSCVSSASKYFTKFPIEEEKHVQQRQKQDYGQNIKTKRLQGKQIRQIHLISEQSQFDIGEVQKQMQENLGMVNIKPSQLSSILQKEASNRNIFCLKIITFIILAISNLLCITQYISVWQEHKILMGANQKMRKMYELGSQILYMKMYATKFSHHTRTLQQLQMLTKEINLLDQYLDLYSYSSETMLYYSDGSKEQMMLGFALNKLISQANSLKSYSSTLNKSDSHVYFVNYNTLNGLIKTTQHQNILTLGTYNNSIQNLTTIQVVYLGVAIGVFLVAMIVKNFLLRIILKKKSQILQVFFEIPRKACSSIQKQCQRFIQRLSSQNQQDMEVLSMASEGSETGLTEDKKHHKQKKRTVMGEEKTTNNYIIATVAFLVILIFFHIFAMIYYETSKQNLTFSMEASKMIFNLQEQAALITNLINSFASDPSISFLQKPLSQSMQVIDLEFKEFEEIYSQIATKFYLIGNVFDNDYMFQYNQLSYNNLCQKAGKNSSQCDLIYGQNYGLNVILAEYHNLINKKYIQLKGFYNDFLINSTEASILLTNERLKRQRQGQFLLKQHWRDLTNVVKRGLDRMVKHNDTVIFAVMLTMCVANLTILLFCWLKFYHNLEQKIAATQYILTFIPIDQINRNPKIANYIKQEILEKR